MGDSEAGEMRNNVDAVGEDGFRVHSTGMRPVENRVHGLGRALFRKLKKKLFPTPSKPIDTQGDEKGHGKRTKITVLKSARRE